MADPSITFGPFVFDPKTGTLSREGKIVRLGHRGALLLGVLLRSPGEVILKTDLMDAVWPGTAVEESNLSVQVAALRKVLGPAPHGEWIATVPRVGYRFISDAKGHSPNAIRDEEAKWARPLVAVLPFQNLSGDPAQDYFADGVVDDIITALSRFRSFAVIGRNSSFAYRDRKVGVRQVSEDLGVRYVLEGSVRRSGERLRISAQLVDGATALHLWAQHFDGGVDDVFDFQDHITESVASRIEPNIEMAEIERSRLERPGSIATYDLYLQALSLILSETRDDNARALALLAEGLALEPDNAMILAHSAWALEHRATMGWPPIGRDDLSTCIAFARRGLDHAHGDTRVMAHCGIALLQVAKDYDLAMAVIGAAVEANPNNLIVATAAGIANLHCGSVDDALLHLQRAIRLSPRDPMAHIAHCGIAHTKIVLGAYDEALDWATRSLAINAHFDATYWMLIASSAHLGRQAETQRHLRAYLDLNPNATVSTIRAGQPDKVPARMESVLEGLRLAGLPEG